MLTTSRDGLLLVGHGSRDPSARMEHDALEALVRAAFPRSQVESGFIELSEPPLSLALNALAQACDRVVVVPLLLFVGGHMQRDVPRAIAEAQQRSPRTRFAISQPFGREPAAVQRAVDNLQAHVRSGAQSASLLVGRGAAESEAQQGFMDVARQLAQRAPTFDHAQAYCGVQQPNVADALDALANSGAGQVVVVPYLLFAGKLLRDIEATIVDARQRHPGIEITRASHLGPTVIDAVVASIEGAMSAGFSAENLT